MPKVSWEFYIKRKKINEKDWISSKGISNFDEFCEAISKLGIKIPEESIKERLFPSKKEIVEEIKKPKERPKKQLKVIDPS